MRYLSSCFTDFDNLLPQCILATAASIAGQCIHRGMTLQKVSISFYYLPPNSENSANNRLRAKPVKYSNFYDIIANVWSILRKFCKARHIPNLMSDHKFPFRSIIVKCNISAVVSLILIKFSATMHISHCNFNSRSVQS